MGGEIPDWAVEGIRNSKFNGPVPQVRTGYILEIFGEDRKIDAQLYEPVDDGRHIVTMDLPDGIDAGSLERGVVYEFRFDSHKAPLQERIVEFLRKERGVEMYAIYQFVLREANKLD